jgi:hypothetical protein
MTSEPTGSHKWRLICKAETYENSVSNKSDGRKLMTCYLLGIKFDAVKVIWLLPFRIPPPPAHYYIRISKKKKKKKNKVLK